ncbi:MAG: S41 family peptidase [Ignavibacteria bacterium]|nr:S41 family peptidase [Ignavibacteria bacterium]
MKKYVIFILLQFFCIFNIRANDSINRVVDIQVQKFRNILETIYNNYYREDIDLVNISEVAFNSLLQSLDKFCNYYPSSQYQAIKDSYKGSTKGIGIQFFRRGDSLIIFHIVKGSPADSVGLLVGDRVIYINHEYCVGKDANFANKKIQESKNNIVIVTVKRDNLLKEFLIPLKEVEIPSVVTKLKIGNDLGFIRINRFSLTTYNEITGSLDSLIKIGCKFFAIDLRNNQGGYLDEVVKICNLFLRKGDTIVIVSGKNENRRVEIANQQGKYLKYPLVVIVDENTASGGEILASCLQDNDRAIVIGTRTFGKGLVQRTWEFKDGSAFRLTTAEYVSPLGRKIQKDETDKVEFDNFSNVTLSEEQKKNIEDMIKQFGIKTKLPTYFTKKGRPILGGGGVFPDYFFVTDTTPQYLKKLKTNGLMNDFVIRNFIDDPKSVMSLMKHNLSSFIINFEVLDNTILNFRQYLTQKNAFLEKNFTEEKNQIVLEIKATLGYILFGDVGYYSVVLLNDKVLSKINELRKEAEKMVNN